MDIFQEEESIKVEKGEAIVACTWGETRQTIIKTLNTCNCNMTILQEM